MDDIKKLTTSHIKRLYAGYHQAGLNKQELTELVKQDTNKIARFLDPSCPWSHWYDIPYKTMLACFLAITNLLDDVINISKQPNPEELMLDLLESGITLDDEDLSEEEQAVLASLGMAIFIQVDALSVFSEPINNLVQRFKDGDDQVLFDAILIDRTVISTPSVAKRLQIAQLMNDESFFQQIAKAITRTRARKPNKKFNDLRFVMVAIKEHSCYAATSKDELYKLVADELELYPADTKDSFSSFFRFIDRIRKPVNDTK